MSRSLLLLALALACFLPRILPAQDDGPPIAITSPDTATTFAFGTIKHHALIWDKSQRMLIARITFIDESQDLGQSSDDTHDFRLPGVTYDEAKGIFSAKTARGEIIPIAHIKKALFTKSIETLPNAVVRVVHPKGDVTVILEAINPGDAAMHAAPGDTNPDDTHQIDISKLLN